MLKESGPAPRKECVQAGIMPEQRQLSETGRAWAQADNTGEAEEVCEAPVQPKEGRKVLRRSWEEEGKEVGVKCSNQIQRGKGVPGL